jgi:HK97 gp10 family phage protein|nr:MAG TPA: putative tail component [Caudoviricetes sp.]
MTSIKGLDELLANLSGLGGNVKESARKGLERGAKKIQKNAKLLTPVDTGDLRNSIKTNSKTTAEGAEAQVYTNMEYAPYVEFGTGPIGNESGMELPEGMRARRITAWTYTPDGGKHFYRTRGQKPQPFMSSAYLYAKDNNTVEQEVTKSIQSDIRKLESGK